MWKAQERDEDSGDGVGDGVGGQKQQRPTGVGVDSGKGWFRGATKGALGYKPKENRV